MNRLFGTVASLAQRRGTRWFKSRAFIIPTALLALLVASYAFAFGNFGRESDPTTLLRIEQTISSAEVPVAAVFLQDCFTELGCASAWAQVRAALVVYEPVLTRALSDLDTYVATAGDPQYSPHAQGYRDALQLRLEATQLYIRAIPADINFGQIDNNLLGRAVNSWRRARLAMSPVQQALDELR